MITQPIFHSCSCLFSRTHNNHPFRNAREKVGKESFKWAERMTEMGAQFGMIELGRVGKMTSKLAAGKVVQKMREESGKSKKYWQLMHGLVEENCVTIK